VVEREATESVTSGTRMSISKKQPFAETSEEIIPEKGSKGQAG